MTFDELSWRKRSQKFEKEFPRLTDKLSCDQLGGTVMSVISECCVDKQRLRDIMKRLGRRNIMLGNDSEEHKLIRTGYRSAFSIWSFLFLVLGLLGLGLVIVPTPSLYFLTHFYILFL